MKALVCVVSLLAMTAAVSGANLLVNGDFSMDEPAGWTRWNAPWGNYGDWTISGGTGKHGLPGPGTWNSYGWYQAVAVPAGTACNVSGTWKGDVDPFAWAEVMLFSVPAGTPAATIVSTIDTGAAANIAAKKDGWGLNPPAVWGWSPISAAPTGNAGSVVSQGLVVVATKIGTGDWNPNHNALYVEFDELVLTPEPATALLLGLALPFIRRRRA